MYTGHVKQVAAFEKLLGFCDANGAMFNPSKESLKVTALKSLLTSAQQSLEAVKSLRTAYDNAVNHRIQAFKSLPTFMTRVVNMLATTADPDTVQEAYAFARKFQTKPKRKPADGEASPSPTRSTSQLDFDAKTDNFAAFVKVVSAEPSYNPNEVDLQVPALEAMVTRLRDINTAVIDAQVALSNARKTRNELLYKNDGIYDSARRVKRYVKGAFGFRSTAYSQISSIPFLKQTRL
jgi:hypothetical protein